MSTISGVSGGRTGWQDASETRGARGTDRRDRMFAKVDSNGDGSVDGAELQGMLDKMAQRSGGTAANADDVLKTMDSDGSGALSADELDAGMKSLMPAPASTMDFAQRRSDDDERIRGDDGPAPADASTATGAADPDDGIRSLLSNLFQAADTDGNGTLNKSEIETLRTNLDTAIQSLEGDSGSVASTTGSTGSTSSTGGDSTGTGTSGNSADGGLATLTALANLVLKEYAATAASSSAAPATAINLSA